MATALEVMTSREDEVYRVMTSREDEPYRVMTSREDEVYRVMTSREDEVYRVITTSITWVEHTAYGIRHTAHDMRGRIASWGDEMCTRIV